VGGKVNILTQPNYQQHRSFAIPSPEDTGPAIESIITTS
jgi:hypothetical protein